MVAKMIIFMLGCYSFEGNLAVSWKYTEFCSFTSAHPLGGCPRIEIFSQIEAFFENKHRHTPSISSIIFKK